MNHQAPVLLPCEETIAIVGVGLIGGSIAAALKKRQFAGRIIGVGRNRQRLQATVETGLIDAGTTDLAQAAGEAGILIFCTPVDLIVEGIRTAAAHCRAGTLITDAGSVKGTLCEELANGLPEGVTYIGSHPLAGSEARGYEHADADLFEGRVCVVTPDGGTSAAELARLKRLWQSLGLTVVERPAADHDRALAQTSHLPHVVAAALAAQLSEDNRQFAATGFRDTTRIASGDPALWIAILLANAEQVVRQMDSFTGELAAFRDSLANRDAKALKSLLENAKRNRDAVGS